VASYLVAERVLSVNRAAAAVKLSRAAYYGKPQGKPVYRQQDDQPVIDALNELVDKQHR